ncbi:MAG: aldo/keto reductase, partial [Bacteroidota bacterium]
MSMLPPRFVTLNNDIEMPIMGLGAWDMYGAEAEQAVVQALEVGYWLIDTAAMYNNEEDVGRALQRSDVHRSEVFVTTKLNNTAHGYDAALKAFDESLNKLGLDQVDLYLIHWPIRAGRKESWKALEKIYADGRARAIGVANYDRVLLEELFETAGIVPAVNQIECSPWLFQPELMEYCRAKHIQIQSYCPITRG